jgi:pimeloyl-ACP methyl ester carboxylesterase
MCGKKSMMRALSIFAALILLSRTAWGCPGGGRIVRPEEISNPPQALLSGFTSAGDSNAFETASLPRIPAAKDYVVLVHGLGRGSLSMKGLEWSLKRAGYRVINGSYRSCHISIEQAADDWLDPLIKERATDPTVQIHFVTHSLGGIVVRQYLAQHHLENLGRVVMLAPPNQGSEIVDHVRNNFLFKFFFGPAGQELGTRPDDLPTRLGPADFELGVIAGDRSFYPWSFMVPGRTDGTVSVESTKLDGMKDFLVVHRSHTFIGWHSDVHHAVKQFLQSGHFQAGAT